MKERIVTDGITDILYMIIMMMEMKMMNPNNPLQSRRGRPKKEKRIQRSIYVNSLINEFLKNQDNANNYLLRLIIDSNDFRKFLKNNKLKFSVDETHDYTQTTKTFFHKNLSF